jgi:hypothetical protein
MFFHFGRLFAERQREHEFIVAEFIVVEFIVVEFIVVEFIVAEFIVAEFIAAERQWACGWRTSTSSKLILFIYFITFI